MRRSRKVIEPLDIVSLIGADLPDEIKGATGIVSSIEKDGTYNVAWECGYNDSGLRRSGWKAENLSKQESLTDWIKRAIAPIDDSFVNLWHDEMLDRK